VDFPVVQAITMTVVVTVFAVNTFVDWMQRRIDPRLRHREPLAPGAGE
jgi:ABC-type dipeptide/oligopeptide/nickel transport system permease component